jgi:hypothetical protein
LVEFFPKKIEKILTKILVPLVQPAGNPHKFFKTQSFSFFTQILKSLGVIFQICGVRGRVPPEGQDEGNVSDA